MASRHTDYAILDGIGSQLAAPSSTSAKTTKPRGTKSRSADKSPRDSVGINANADCLSNSKEKHVAQSIPSTSAMTPTTTQSELAHLPSTGSALAKQMNWFMSKLTEDDSEADTGRNIETDDRIYRFDVIEYEAPEPKRVDVLTGLEDIYDARENIAPVVDEQLANIDGNLCHNKMLEDKLKEKLTSYVRP